MGRRKCAFLIRKENAAGLGSRKIGSGSREIGLLLPFAHTEGGTNLGQTENGLLVLVFPILLQRHDPLEASPDVARALKLDFGYETFMNRHVLTSHWIENRDKAFIARAWKQHTQRFWHS